MINIRRPLLLNLVETSHTDSTFVALHKSVQGRIPRSIGALCMWKFKLFHVFENSLFSHYIHPGNIVLLYSMVSFTLFSTLFSLLTLFPLTFHLSSWLFNSSYINFANKYLCNQSDRNVLSTVPKILVFLLHYLFDDMNLVSSTSLGTKYHMWMNFDNY